MPKLVPLSVVVACLLSSLAADAFHIGSLDKPKTKSRTFLSSSVLHASSETAETNHVVFNYCTGCRWMPRAIWMSQELLTTFNDDNLSAISLVPSRPPPGARFVVTHYDGGKSTVLWDREKEEGFPAMKDMKQLVRDKINPEKYLGHSDSSGKEEREGAHGKSEDAATVAAPAGSIMAQVLSEVPEPNVSIKYCTGCRWMLRSAYFATELLTTFDTEINSLTLIPSRPPEKGGIFTVTLNGKTIWDREVGGFPETKELKQIIRDLLAPSKDLGHSDYDPDKIPDIDEDEAENMRAFFGVQ